MNVFSTVSKNNVYGPLFFEENTITGHTFLNMQKNWLFPLFEADLDDLILQLDEAQPHWHLMVQTLLNKNVPQRWIELKGGHKTWLFICVFQELQT